MTASKRCIPALVFAFALPAAPIPGALPSAAAPAPATAETRAAATPVAPRPFIRKIHVKVWEAGSVAPNVSVHVPTFLVSTAVKVMSVTGLFDRAIEEARRHTDAADCPRGIRLNGRQIDALWSALVNSGPVSLVEVDDGAGGRVEIRAD